jgi:hypothetical protein
MLDAKNSHNRIRCLACESLSSIASTLRLLSRTAIPPQARQPKLFLQPRHIQAVNIPATRLALAVQHQRAHMPERLPTALLAAHKRAHNALLGPVQHCVDIGAAAPDLRMHVEVHEEWRVPPLPEAEKEKRRVVQFGAFAGLDMVDQAGVGAHWGVAAPAGEFGGSMFGHMLSFRQYNDLEY